MDIIIIGGSAGGCAAAARLRRLFPSSEHHITIVERGDHVSYANCGLPYYVGKVLPRRESLFVTPREIFERRLGITLLTRTEAVAVRTRAHEVDIRDAHGTRTLRYDRLLLSPGAEPILPPPLRGLTRIATLRSIPDADTLRSRCDRDRITTVAVVGGGFIGLELAENLLRRGMQVTLIEAAPQILAPLDPEMAQYAADALAAAGVALRLGTAITSATEDGARAHLTLSNGEVVSCNLVASAAGVRPASALLDGSGIARDERGFIRVNRRMETSAKDVLAIGDAVTITDVQNPRVALAGPAAREARVAAATIAGG
ncbi:MAG: FAD-dependent oxidoreductase, partial [Succinivibrionaceae bacterium]|nr:FAD-dependent oxidoreductase [Succinivibrionaceae bacterium]